MLHSPLLLQIVIILATARACGWLLRHVGQPPVIGEMAAGIVLGPIVFGALFPDFHTIVFAKDSLPGLTSLSTLGLASMHSSSGRARRCESSRSYRLRSIVTPPSSSLTPCAL